LEKAPVGMKRETDASFYQSDGENFLRSSALKSLETCSWLYYCNYILKLPQKDNRGALMGNVCHSFFECLLNPRRKKTFTAIVKAGTICAKPSTERLVRKLIRNNHLLDDKETFEKIDGMILVGLKTDFFVKGGKVVGKEHRFKIQSETPRYFIYGTIDKIALTKTHIVIDDFKSSKLKYSGEDINSSVQALMYSLACKKLWPDLTPKVRFIFLQYPKEPHQEVAFSDQTLKGFEYYLADVQKRVDNFHINDAYANFAADHPIPKDGSFHGRLACGFATRPDQLKKDGTPMWHCPYKFPFFYYALKDKDGKVVQTSLKDDLTAKEGQSIIKLHYAGCPKYRPPIDTF